MIRQVIPDYLPRAVHEAIVNALCHRDYTIIDGATSLMVYDERLEVTSHGGLPLSMAVNDLKCAHESQPRNQKIAQVLYSCGIIEEFCKQNQVSLMPRQWD